MWTPVQCPENPPHVPPTIFDHLDFPPRAKVTLIQSLRAENIVETVEVVPVI